MSCEVVGGAFLLTRLGTNPIDVEDDLAGALREDTWDHEVAIIEERKYGIEKVSHSDRLCDRVWLFTRARDRRAQALSSSRSRNGRPVDSARTRLLHGEYIHIRETERAQTSCCICTPYLVRL